MDNHPMGWPLLYETPLGMLCLYRKVMEVKSFKISAKDCQCRVDCGERGDICPEKLESARGVQGSPGIVPESETGFDVLV